MEKTNLPLDSAGFSLDRMKKFNLDITYENWKGDTMRQKSIWFDLGFVSLQLFIRWEQR